MPKPAWDQDRLFGRRQSKPLRARQAGLMEDLLPRLAIGPETAADAVAAHDGPVWLEVGFGGGEHLAFQAEANPDHLLIGAEPFINGVAKLLAHIDERDIPNIRVRHGDVRPLMTALQDGCLDRIFVLHPDPWPKAKHRKRRMISPGFLAEAARLLPPGGILRVASDIPDYITWTLMQVERHNRGSGDFEWLGERRADWTERATDWPQTRYERKALREGRVPTYLVFRRL